MSTQPHVELKELEDTYEIVGELHGREDARAFLGTRRADGAAVLIAVVRPPGDDEGNALSLLAADTNLLATLTHRNLLPVIEGRWAGPEAFAVISRRIAAPALDEVIAREEMSYPRIAAILQQVNELLEWARAQKIVHRAVTPDTLFLEPESDRVLAAFVISPIPFGRVSPIGVDARTIGELAKAMLAGHPDVATRVMHETNALLELSHTSEAVPDIPAYIAAIAVADALKRGEIESAHATDAIAEQQRLARERLDTERADHEREIAEQRRALAQERQELGKEREKLEKEREKLEKMREKLEKEREEARRETQRETQRRPLVPPPPMAASPDPYGRSWWNVGIVAGALVVILAISTVAIGRGHGPQVASQTPTAASDVIDSPGGEVVPSIVPLPNVTDSMIAAAASADSARLASAQLARRARMARRTARAVPPPAPPSVPESTSRPTLAQRDSLPRRDTASPPNVPGLRLDSVRTRDFVVPRTDTIRRPDTPQGRDTIARRDTMP